MTTKQMLYLVGIPGSGKTSLLAVTLAGVPIIGQATKPVPHVVYPGGCQLGTVNAFYTREGPKSRRSPGTDSSSMSVQPRVLQWLQGSCPYQNIVGEGDRLANLPFFTGVRAAGWELTVVHLDTPESLALDRCITRGSNQALAWWKGRVTKVHNLLADLQTILPIVNLSGTLPLDVLAAQLHTFPAVRELARTTPKKG